MERLEQKRGDRLVPSLLFIRPPKKALQFAPSAEKAYMSVWSASASRFTWPWTS